MYLPDISIPSITILASNDQAVVASPAAQIVASSHRPTPAPSSVFEPPLPAAPTDDVLIARFALAQLARMPLEDRRALVKTVGAGVLGQSLNIRQAETLAAFAHAARRLCMSDSLDWTRRCRDEGLQPCDLPPDKRAQWDFIGNKYRAILCLPPKVKHGMLASEASRRSAKRPYQRHLPGGGAQRELQASDAVLSRTAEQRTRLNQLAVLMATQDEYGQKLRIVYWQLLGWPQVSVAMQLSVPGDRAAPLADFMAAGAEDRGKHWQLVQREVVARQETPELAEADRQDLYNLAERLNALIAGGANLFDANEMVRVELLDDVILAMSGFKAWELKACIEHCAPGKFARAMGLVTAHPMVQEVADGADLAAVFSLRLQGPNHAIEGDRVQRPTRVAAMRDSIQVILARAGATAAPHSIVTPGVEAKPDLPIDDDIAFVPPQRYEPGIRASKLDGTSWLAGLELCRAAISDAAWAGFEAGHLVAAGMSPDVRAALRQRLEAGVRAQLAQPPSTGEDAHFQLLTTLDDGHERGRGVVARTAIAAFEPLFLYGGTVCASQQESDAYRERHMAAWMYAYEVGLKDVRADGSLPADATCFAYPAGNIGSCINTYRLRGSARQLHRAANVVTLLVTVPGLPFGLPFVVSVQDVAAGDELFIDYGKRFRRYVEESLQPLPRWPVVKQETGLRQAATNEESMRILATVKDVPTQAQPPATLPALRDWPAWLAGAGFEVRALPRNGDSCFHALEGHVLDATQLQVLRHDMADAMTRQAAESAAASGELGELGVRAHLLRLPGHHGDEAAVQAWCRLGDERREARGKQGRKRAGAATSVAVLDACGSLVLLTAAGRYVHDPDAMSSAAWQTLLARELGKATVALLRDEGCFHEIQSIG